MDIKNVRGSLDYLPEEQRIRDYIKDTLREVFLTYGYLDIETPILMYYDTLAGKYDEGNDLLKEIYKLSDQGKRNLGLRYDLTVPFAKFIALNKNKLTFPFKRYEIAKVFRDGPVKLGRDREFTQCDCDVVGISGQLIEVECLQLYVDAFERLGIPIIIKYNSRNLLGGLILESGISKELIPSTITVIDKMTKLTTPELVLEFKKIGLQEENINRLLEYFSYSKEELTEKFSNSKVVELQKGLEEINRLANYIEEMGISSYCQFTISLARGQDYYTGNIFEVYEKTGKLTCSIGGGGRYDDMIGNFLDDGNYYPAVGISFGLTAIYELLTMNDSNNSSYLDLYIVPLDSNSELASLKLARELRKRGVKTSLEMKQRKVKKCLEWANKNGVPYVIVIGEDEIAKGKVILKAMDSGEKKEFLFTEYEAITKEIQK